MASVPGEFPSPRTKWTPLIPTPFAPSTSSPQSSPTMIASLEAAHVPELVSTMVVGALFLLTFNDILTKEHAAIDERLIGQPSRTR